jgi:hypothetical protein
VFEAHKLDEAQISQSAIVLAILQRTLAPSPQLDLP